MVQVDADCDGFTSAALLINYLYQICPNFVIKHIKYRIHEGKEHGIIPDTIPKGVKLVIAPDSSSNQYDEHELLAKSGIDVLVLDHHEASQVSQFACVINNQLCDYPTKSLSGVGVVYKFCQYLDAVLGKNLSDQFIDLVSLGMIADVMCLRDFETKHLVQKGLVSLRNPYFVEMVKKQSYPLGETLTPDGIAFYIAPYVNATIRVGTQDEKLILFESMLDFKGYQLISSTKRGCKGQMETRVEQACRNCVNIKKRQTDARDASLNVIERIIEKEELLKNKLLIVKLYPEYAVEKNLTGLIANQLMGKYQRPVLLLNYHKDEEGNILWSGSGRGYDKSSFTDFRGFIEESGLAEFAEGHANAFGSAFKPENLEQFINYSNEFLKDFNFSPCYLVDYIWNAHNFNVADILEIASLKSVWGQGVEESKVALENITITKDNITLMSRDRNPTLKITLPNGLSLVKFRSNAEEYENLYSELGCVKINIVGKCEQNIWNGIINPQIIVDEYQIIDRKEYYF